MAHKKEFIATEGGFAVKAGSFGAKTQVINPNGSFAQNVATLPGGYVYPVVAPNATVVAKATNANLAAADLGKNITNTGASGTIALTQTAAATVAGTCFRIQLTVAEIVRLTPTATGKVFLGGSGVANKYLEIAGVIGNYADIYCDGTDYHVVGYSGVLTKQA
jgi:hypothetical protein